MSRAMGLGHRTLTVRDAAAKGRQGDSLLVHVSPEEWALGASVAGDDFSINPDTGLAEHFSFGKILKGVAKAAAALVGGELGGPAGAAAGGLIASKALGDSWQTAISTSALSGLGAWGVQQTGAADSFGGGLSSGSDLLGRAGGDANFTGLAKYAVPALAGVIGLSGLGGSGKTQSTQPVNQTASNANDYNNKPFDWQPPLDRTQYSYPGDFSTYGQTGGEHQWFDNINPQPTHGFAQGGAVGRYDTRLSADQERAFQAWKQRYAPNDSGEDYDLRGAFLSGLTPAANGHWPDTFKKPGEPTFSDQSIYAGSQPDAAGHWIDDTTYVPAQSHRLDMGFKKGGKVSDSDDIAASVHAVGQAMQQNWLKAQRAKAQQDNAPAYTVNTPGYVGLPADQGDYLVNAPADQLENITGPGGADASLMHLGAGYKDGGKVTPNQLAAMSGASSPNSPSSQDYDRARMMMTARLMAGGMSYEDAMDASRYTDYTNARQVSRDTGVLALEPALESGASLPDNTAGYALGGEVRYFKYGGDTNEGGAHGFSGGAGSSGKSSGSSGSGAYNGQGRPNAPASAPSGAFTGNGGGGPMSGSGNATTADRQIIDKYVAASQPDYSGGQKQHILSDRDFWNAAGNLGQRSNDFMNRGNSTLDNLGNALAGLVSVGEMDPTKQALGASIDNPDASWGVDPVGLGATILGTFTGLPIGSLYKGAKKLTGYPGPQIAFDGNQYGNYGFNSSPIGQGLGVMSAADMDKAIASGATGSAFGSLGGPGGSPASLGNDTRRGETALPTGLGALVANGGTGAGNPGSGDGSTPPVTPPVDPAQAGRHYLPFTGDYSTYGQQGEHAFYDPINTPMGPVTLASGGEVNGFGDGQTDTIPAMLAPGEHVIDSATVAALGNGNNAEGQRVLQAMKTKVRRKMGLKNPSRPPRKVELGAMAA